MLDIRGLRFRYGKRAPVLSGVDLTLEDGRIGILLGQNGAGKTTLFKLLLGLEKPESGTILFDGQDLTRLSPSQRARCVGYVPQHIHFGAQFFELLLLANAETVFFVDDHETQAVKGHLVGKQLVRPDHNVDRAVADPFNRFGGCLPGTEAREFRHLNGPGGKAIDKGAGMLLGKKRCRA